MDISINCRKSEWNSFFTGSIFYSKRKPEIGVGDETKTQPACRVDRSSLNNDHNIISESCLWSAEVENDALNEYGVLTFVCIVLLNST